MSDTLPEAADVVWVVGTPRRPTSTIWQQILSLLTDGDKKKRPN